MFYEDFNRAKKTKIFYNTKKKNSGFTGVVLII
jgi:hypothetical protein